MSQGKKIAVTIGIEYVKSSISTLNGTYNDSLNMSRFLMSEGYNVTNLNDKNNPVNSTKYPSKRNIMYWMSKVLNEANNGDRVVIAYAGHGAQLQANRTANYEELDNRDETLIPADYNYKQETALTDDEIHALLKKYLKNQPNTEVFLLFDCCHSGTMADLKYTYNLIRGKFQTHDDKQTNDIDARVVMISGCRDDQVSWGALISHDTDGNNGRKTNQGVLTSSFLHALRTITNARSNVFEIVKHMYKYTAPYKQQPQISSNVNLGADKHILSDIARQPTTTQPPTKPPAKPTTKPTVRPVRVRPTYVRPTYKKPAQNSTTNTTKKVLTTQELYAIYRKKLRLRQKNRYRYRYRYRKYRGNDEKSDKKTRVASGLLSMMHK
jgi:hypothetical protein